MFLLKNIYVIFYIYYMYITSRILSKLRNSNQAILNDNKLQFEKVDFLKK